MNGRDIYSDGHGFRDTWTKGKDPMTKAAKTPKRVVTLSPNGDGYYSIIVDGQSWGQIARDQHGSHGSTYHVNNSKHRRVFVPVYVRSPGSKDKSRVDLSLWGDKKWLRDLGYHGSGAKDRATTDGVYKTIEVRLVEAITRAIDGGHFKSPDQLDADAKAESDRVRRAQEQRDATEAAKLADVVTKAIGPEVPKFIGAVNTEDLRARILEALQWARVN